MGIVYRGADEALMRTVAIKTLKDSQIDATKRALFLEEAKRLARLNHQNVVRIFDVGEFGKRPYFVMEYLEGITLSSRLARGPISLNISLRILQAILEGVHAIHQLGMVHRDIKPGNVILSDDLLKTHLLDFGLALESAPMRERAGLIDGTRGYIPPERFSGLPGDYRGDFFSFGCIAYEMLAGTTMDHLLKGSQSNRFCLDKIAETDQWRQIPDGIRRAVIGMLQNNPDKRLCNYAAIIEAFEFSNPN